MSANEFIGLYLKSASELYGMPYDSKALMRLAAIVGQEPEFTLKIAAADAAPLPEIESGCRSSVPVGTYSSGYRRVAPGMMRGDGETPYARLAWSVAAFPCDLVTGEILVSRCPACGKELTWHTDRICQCDSCPFDVRDIEPIFCPHEELADIRVIAGMMGWQDYGGAQRPALPEPFGSLPANDLVAALGWCAYLQGVLDRSGIGADAAHAHLGLPVALAWPTPLDQLASLMTRQLDSRVYDLQAAMQLLLGDGLPRSLAEHIRLQAAEAMQRAVHSRASDTERYNRSYLTLPNLATAARRG